MQLRKAVLLCCLMGLSITGLAAEKVIYGLTEQVKIVELGNIEIPAKLDTGAFTASLNAKDIKRFEKNGQKWVRFTPVVKGEKFAPIELPLAGFSKIKRRAADVDDDDEKAELFTKRPRVELQVCMGSTMKTIEVNLTDRSAFRFPFLIGSSALKEFDAVVDPSLKNQLQAKCLVNKK